VTCIESIIDPLSPAPHPELYGAFHAENTTSCAPGSFTPSLSIDVSFLESSWSGSPFPSSPCTPISYAGGPLSPVEAVQAPSTPAFDLYNMMTQFDSCGGVGFDSNQGTALPPEGFSPLVHESHPHQQSYPPSKGSFPFPFYSHSHKLPVPEVASLDVADFTDVFTQSSQAFAF
jgi:hypothetical protein